VAAARDFKIRDAGTDFSGFARRFCREIMLLMAHPAADRIVARGIVRMAEIKGPAIATDTFRVEGHCCGIRIPALMDPSSAGVRFELSPEIRAALLEAGIHAAEVPPDEPRSDEVSEPHADQKPGQRPG
jgi:hypothetical protein